MDSLQFFKSLADDTRLKILLLICHEQELCVCELTQALQLSQPKISRHIALLRESGLIIDRKVGRWVYYHLAEQLLPWQQASLQQCLANELRSQSEAGAYVVNVSSPGFSLTACLRRLTDGGSRPIRQQECCDKPLADYLL